MKKREFDLVLGSSWSPSADTDLLSSAAQSTEGETSAHLTAKVNIALSGIVRRQKPGEVMELAQCHCGLGQVLKPRAYLDSSAQEHSL